MRFVTTFASISFSLLILAAGCGDDDAQPPDGSIGSADAGTDGGLPGVCGDGTQNAGEECDDGNAMPGDGCEPDCTLTGGPMIVVCPAADLPALPSGTCEVTAGDASKLITATVLTPGKVYRGGQVLVDAAGQIACVDCDCSAGAAAATKITCPDGVLSAGLINAHDHITFAQNDPYNDTGERYEHRHDWRRGQRGHTEINSAGGATVDQIQWGELRFLMGGATSTIGSGSATGFLRNLDRAVDQEGLGQQAVHYETFPLGDTSGTQLESGCGYPAIDTAASIAGDDAYFPHISEGIDTVARNEFLCVSSSTGGGQDLLAPQSNFIHSVGLKANDYAQMATEGTALIWSPRSNVTLYGQTAMVTTAHRQGVLVALGTDWMPTGSMNMLRELRCADELNRNYYGGYFTDEQLWLMVTQWAAEAAAMHEVIGSIAVGKVADLTIFAGDRATRADHRAVLDAEAQDVALVLRGGEVLYGDVTVVTGFAGGAGCDTLDVCGTTKAVCAAADLGKSLAQLQSGAGAGIYPAFFCGEPDNEPSCVPTRPVAVNNSTIYTGAITATDGDGDGIPNASDKCPTVFDPARPLDGGAQPDFDSDGEGDACDVCPLDADTTTCTTVNPDDSDADGVPNATDNCPAMPNADQADVDSDGHGDVCDACPMVPNPGPAGCPATIYEIKNGTVSEGSTVSVENVLVTGRVTNGFFVQAKVGDPGYAGADFSGVYVYAPGNTVAAGDRVTLTSAVVDNFFGQIQLNMATVVIDSSTGEAPPDPVVETAAAVATGGARAAALEAVIVRVENVSVTSVTPAPGPGDVSPTNEFAVEGSLRVNDMMYLVTPFPTVGESFASITGILDWRNGNSKLEPRNAADVVAGAVTLAGFGPATSYTREGVAGAATFPTPLTVTLSRATTSDTFVAVTSGDPASLTVAGGGVTVLAGTTSAPVLVSGLAQAASVTLTATLDTTMLTATVRVLGAAEAPVLTGLTPAIATVAIGGSAPLTVTLDIPAPPGGTTVALEVAPAGAGTLPASVTVLENEVAATFTYTDGGTVTMATVTATLGGDVFSSTVNAVMGGGHLVINEVDYDQIGTDTGEFVELYNASAAPIDLSLYALVFVNGSSTPSPEYRRVALSGTLPAGGYAVVASTTVTVDPGALRFDFAAASDNIQNGAPDALGILELASGVLVDALSYEGSITMGSVTGVTGTLSFVEGSALPVATADSNVAVGSLVRQPNGVDTDNAATDWAFSSTPTPGTAN